MGSEELQPRVADYPIPENPIMDCRACPGGATLSVTVFFRGLGSVRGFADLLLGQNLAPSREEAHFPQRIVAKLGATERDPCCRHEIVTVDHDPKLSIRRNATLAARAIRDGLLARGTGYPWLNKIHLHLIGFSAGGLLALEVARKMSTAPVRTAPMWCNLGKTALAPVEMDLVTIATPFDVEYDGGFFDFLGLFTELGFFGSIAASAYGGPPPTTLCAFTAFVSSKVLGDETSGADRDPKEDEQLPGWFDVGTPIKRASVVYLKDHWLSDPDRVEHHVSHTELLDELLDSEKFGQVLLPGCRCHELPGD